MAFPAISPRGATFNIVGSRHPVSVNARVSNNIENGTSAALGEGVGRSDICVHLRYLRFLLGGSGWQIRNPKSEIRNRCCYSLSMGKAEWGADPEFFGPRHAHREGRLLRRLREVVSDPGLHLECAAGVGSLSLTLAREGWLVIAADLSPLSLQVLRDRAEASGLGDRVLPVVADITHLPFADETFPSSTTAETLEHIPDHEAAVGEISRVLAPCGWLVGTVPAGPRQWSDWDDWAGHLRRYTATQMAQILDTAGLEPAVVVWGWPVLRLYDDFFLKKVNRRRLRYDGDLAGDPKLKTVSKLGQNRPLVALVRSIFSLDRLFDGVPWGIGLLFAGRKRNTRSTKRRSPDSHPAAHSSSPRSASHPLRSSEDSPFRPRSRGPNRRSGPPPREASP